MYSHEFQDEEEYEYYVVEMMGDFWNEFIELKQFSRITKKYIKIVKKEGGRMKLRQQIIDALGKNFYEKVDEVSNEHIYYEINKRMRR